MTSIKGPTGPGAKPNVEGANGASQPTEATSGPSFKERVAESKSATAASPTDATQGVLTDLRAGKLTPNEAVSRLTDLAMQQNRVPVGMRPAVEAQLRDFLARDPTVRDLMRRMGAAVASSDE